MNNARRCVLACALGSVATCAAMIAVRIAEGHYAHARFDALVLYFLVVVAVHAAFWSERKP